MNKKMRELLAKITQKRMMAKGFMEDGENKDLEKAAALMDEADELQKEYDLEARMYEAEKKDNTPSEEDIQKDKAEKEGKSSIKAIADAIRAVAKTMNEGTGTDGGYTVPEDVETRIQELREAKFSLEQLVDVEAVSTMSGQRTYKTRAQKKGFSKVGEKSKISKIDGPAFSRIKYTIEKYAGYLPITNELLEDSDENLVKTILEWLADESRVTRNNLILEEINKLLKEVRKSKNNEKLTFKELMTKMAEKLARQPLTSLCKVFSMQQQQHCLYENKLINIYNFKQKAS